MNTNWKNLITSLYNYTKESLWTKTRTVYNDSDSRIFTSKCSKLRDPEQSSLL